MISGILNPTNWMGFAKVIVKVQFRHFHFVIAKEVVKAEFPHFYFVIARYLYPSVAISNLHSPTMLDYFHKEDYIKANRPAKPLPCGMRNMVGIFILSLRHCEPLSLPKQSEISLNHPQPGLFQGFVLEPHTVFSFCEWACRKAWLPLQKIKAVHEVMRQILAVDPRFAGMMGVPAGRDIRMCWEVAK